MAVEFTLPKGSNVTFKRKNQDSETLSTTILDGTSVNISVNKPQSFEDGVVGSTVQLSDVLETVDIRYVASTAGYSNGDSVNSWVNSGDLDGYDLQNEGSSPIDHPTFNTDDVNNPFSTGAMKFVISDSDYSSDYLYWGTNDARKTLEPEDAFTFYMVMATTVLDAKKGHYPLWVNGSARDNSAQTAVDSFIGPGTTFTVRLKGPEFTFTEVDILASPSSNDQSFTSSPADGIVIVVTVDKDGVVRHYNANAKSSNEITIDSSRKFKADTFGGPDGRNQKSPSYMTTGDTLYLAEFGYWNSKLDGQSAATLARLLGKKYEIS